MVERTRRQHLIGLRAAEYAMLESMEVSEEELANHRANTAAIIKALDDGSPADAASASIDSLVVGILDDLEVVRNWLNEAPIEELEAVEKAIEQNAPIPEINRAIERVWLLHGKKTDDT